MNKTSRYLVILGLVFTQLPLKMLGNKIDSTSWSLSFSYGLYLPGEDLKLRFGVNNNFGTKISLRTKNGWEFGLEGNILFGNIVKEKNQLDSFLTQSGKLIDPNGQIVDVFFYQRGYTFDLSITKHFNFLQVNPHSGCYVKAQIGFLEHWIKIDTKNKNIPILEKKYLIGFDRLSNGLLSGQEIGYQFIGNNKLSRFFIGLNFIQGYTQNRRSRNFDSQKKNNSPRLDLMFGLNIGWSIKIGKSDQEYFYH